MVLVVWNGDELLESGAQELDTVSKIPSQKFPGFRSYYPSPKGAGLLVDITAGGDTSPTVKLQPVPAAKQAQDRQPELCVLRDLC